MLWSLNWALLVLAVGSVSVIAYAICARRGEPWQRVVELVHLLKSGPRVPPPTPKSRGRSDRQPLDAARNSR
ncbi:hypothetical protein [Saccharothrix luteola]|uniref:hypothetical protein n=1 Tax=Saccharothrix luteola TaxID=2893018 RepID=UPI001E567AFF|nr:hypothetical protein [Saccharothrix luteola]MCC8251295.1 hypothetical protein [Saccharothrix luteola]